LHLARPFCPVYCAFPLGWIGFALRGPAGKATEIWRTEIDGISRLNDQQRAFLLRSFRFFAFQRNVPIHVFSVMERME